MENKTETARAAKMKVADDVVGLFVNGGRCTVQTHEPASALAILIMLRQLLLLLPHQSMNLSALEREIAREVKK